MQDFTQASVQLVCPFLGTVPKQQGSMITPGNKGSINQCEQNLLDMSQNIMSLNVQKYQKLKRLL